MNAAEYIATYSTTPDYIDSDGNVYDEDDLRDQYHDYLDDMGFVEIAGLDYTVSEALKAVDPTAYRCGMADYQSALDWDEWTEDHEWNVTDEDEDEDDDDEECIECGQYVDYGSLCDECAAGTPR